MESILGLMEKKQKVDQRQRQLPKAVAAAQQLQQNQHQLSLKAMQALIRDIKSAKESR